MKKMVFFMMLAFTSLVASAQKFELEKSEPKVVLRFREIVPDTLEGNLLYDGELIEGKVVRHRYKCIFDYHQTHEGDIFYTLPTDYFDKQGKPLDGKKVLGWNLPHNGFAFGGTNMWKLYSNSNLTIPTVTNSNMAFITEDSINTNRLMENDEFLPNGKTFEIFR